MGKGKLKAAIKKVASAPKKAAAKKAEKKKAAPAKKNKGVFKKVGKIGAAVLTGGVSLLADKKVKGKIKKVGGKAKAGLKKAAAKANPIKVLKKVAQGAKAGAEFAALLPFMPPMLIALKAKGIKVKHPAKPKEVAALFYTNIIKKQHLEHCEHLDGYQSGEVALNVAKNLYRNDHHNIVADAAAGISKGIITAILDFFSAKKKQKALAEAEAKGEKVDKEDELTEEEQAVLGGDNETSVADVAMIAAADKATDALVNEVGGTDSEGNEVEPPDEEAEEEQLTGKKSKSGKAAKAETKTPSKEVAKYETKKPVVEKEEEEETEKPTGWQRFFSHKR